MRLYKFLFLLFITSSAFAQYPGSTKTGSTRQNMNVGRFYGKIVDQENKAVDAATIMLTQPRMDSVTKKMMAKVVGGQLTKGNGDFSIENLPVMGQFTLVATAMGYTSLEMTVKFDFKPGGDPSKMMGMVDLDLGNIKLFPDATQLQEVKIVASKPFMQLGVDRKIFNVEKNLVSVGQTATELMKNIPGVDVDIDGNVSLRNASPTIFIDGRPTTLTLDQIPSDAIQTVELITNPSAKYDASGGTSGIINIVLKKNRKAGYNGNASAGIDSRAIPNFGGSINAKQGKVNVSINGNYNCRKSIGEGNSLRDEFFRTPAILYDQFSDTRSNGAFNSFRAEVDYFINNRNTLSVSGSFFQGTFNNNDLISIGTDTLYSAGKKSIFSERVAGSKRTFQNQGTTIAYKKLFTKKNRELTADFNFSKSKSDGNGDFTTQYFDLFNTPQGNPSVQTQLNNGSNTFYTFQVDYVDPIGEKSKIEMGVRSAVRDSKNENLNYVDGVPITAINASSKYIDQVLAAYTTYSSVVGTKTNFQLGLRIENSTYAGTLLTNNKEFGNSFPFSLFPSLNVTHQLTPSQDLQFSYSRKINRPNFFQILPFYDYTDSLNISRGNPDLVPEFTNSVEINYQKSFKGNHSLLISGYYKQTDDLITRYQIKEPSAVPGKEILINSYINANSSKAYGIEVTSRNTVTKFIELTTNFNVFNSSINSSNLQEDLNNSLWSFFGKLNANIKIPQNFTLQLAFDYRGKSILPQNSGGGRSWGGGGGWGGFSQTTAQGYVEPNYGFEFALRKDILKEKRGSLTLSMSDVFKTKLYGTYSESIFFTQTNSRRRDWQVLRLNFSFRFGKVDASIFKRKNTKRSGDGAQEGMQMQ